MRTTRPASPRCAPSSAFRGATHGGKGRAQEEYRRGRARGVFGVPSFVVDGEVFWGADAIEFVKDFLRDHSVLRNDEMRRVDSLPVGAARKS